MAGNVGAAVRNAHHAGVPPPPTSCTSGHLAISTALLFGILGAGAIVASALLPPTLAQRHAARLSLQISGGASLALAMGAGIIACCTTPRAGAYRPLRPPQALTSREILARHSDATTSAYPAVDYDLSSGIFVAVDPQGQKFYLKPGMSRYVPTEATDAILGFKRSSVLNVGLLMDQVHNRPLQEEDVRKMLIHERVMPIKYRYATWLGIVVIHLPTNEILYRTPGMTQFLKLPADGVTVPTGGKIRPDGTIEGEKNLALKPL